MSQAELIVVGAGSAGCVVAARLALEHGLRVTLVEPPSTPASPIDRHRPSRWLNLLGSGDDWNLEIEPSPVLASRRLAWPRGRGLGGSSRINAMIWFPPTERDLRMLTGASGDQWTKEQLSAAYQSVCQQVKPEQPLWLSEDSRRFMAAAGEFSDATPMVYRRVTRQGRRWNPASLLGQEGTDRHRVEVVRATVDQLIWDKDRVIGVRLVDGTSTSDLMALRGVVLSAGTIATPTILMRSGVGPREELGRHGIDVRCEHACVGNHLQDHLIMPVIFDTKSKSIFRLNPSVRDVVRWQTLGAGPLGSNIAECGGLFCDDTIQIHVTPTNFLTYPKPSVAPVMTIGVNLTQPLSRGSITLRSNRADRPPCIDAGYFANQRDLEGTIRGVHLARRFAFETSLAPWISAETLPGAKRASDASIAKSLGRYARTLYHPIGTCCLGAGSEAAVDFNFALKGTQGLWVVDASVLPKLTVGNPNATIMTLASMAADFVSEGIQRE